MYAASRQFSTFEKCHIIGQRAEQIAAGAPVIIPIQPGDTALSLAEREFALGKTPLAVLRHFPNGTEHLKPVQRKA